jgi:hypothetical protein
MKCHVVNLSINSKLTTSQTILAFAQGQARNTCFEQDKIPLLVTKWLAYMALLAVDIQQLKCDKLFGPSEINNTAQLHTWSKFDSIKEGGSLMDIKGFSRLESWI